MSWLSRLANAFRPSSVDRALDEEAAFHLECRINELVAAGMSAKEAEAQAGRAFGNRLRLREESRDVKLFPWLVDCVQDVRVAGRVLRDALPHKDPLSMNAFYVAPTQLGPIDCDVEVLRLARSTSFAQVKMSQGGELKVQVTAAFTDLAALAGESWSSAPRPEYPLWDACAPLPEGAEGIPGVIVPRKMVNEVRKLVEDFDGAIEVSLSDSRIRFAFADIVLTSKLIDGSFPDYQRVIPTANDKILEVDRKEFRDAVDRVSTISSEKSRAVKLSLKPGTLTLSATSAENGSASEELEVKYDGQAMEIGFNSKYLLDVADEIEGEGLELKLADSVAPTLLRDMADAQALYVLMPMRV